MFGWRLTREARTRGSASPRPAPLAFDTPPLTRPRISDEAEAMLRTGAAAAPSPFLAAKPRTGTPAASSRLAMDYNPLLSEPFAYDTTGQSYHEGVGFLGYAYLAELAQRPEYRMVVETTAHEMTRKGFKITSTSPAADDGDDGDARAERVRELEEACKTFDVIDLLRQVAEKDGYFGRAHVYIDPGNSDDASTRLPYVPAKIKQNGKLQFRVIEPFWLYPAPYNATDPLAPDFYRPTAWYVQGKTVDNSRLLTFVGREVADILKPAYAFGGLSLSQMIKPYVDNWLRTRQSVSDLLHSFSIPVLKTTMAAYMAAPMEMLKRLGIFNANRDNRGVMAIDKDTEDFGIFAAPLGSTDKLQAQAQEQIASVAGIPLVVLLGVTPSGLNASSDGEIRTFYAKIAARQEQFFRPHLTTILSLIQLWLWGKIDPTISFVFNPLWETSELDASTVSKNEADRDAVYINAGVVSPEEVRTRLAGDDEGPYHGLSGEAPEPPAMQIAAASEPDDDEPKPGDDADA